MNILQRATLFALSALLVEIAVAAEVTLKAINAFNPGTFFSKRFETFVKKVNEDGEGVVQIKVVGGPEAIPLFEIGNAVRAGVVDVANTSAVFHANLVPEALAMTFTDKSIQELRQNGGHALLDQIHQKKANMRWLARISDGLQYHIYTNQKVDTIEGLKGLKLRSSPIFLVLFREVGASALQLPPGEVYTALERGVVDGYGWPSVGVFDLGWQERTKYRIDPGFYNVEVSLFINQRKWQSLTIEQQQLLEKTAIWIEAQNADDKAVAAQETARLKEAGVEIMNWSEEQASVLKKTAIDAAWASVKKANPKDAAEIEKLFR